mgnify:CR=1 FL=1
MSMRKTLACFTFSLLCTTLAVAQGKQSEEADAAFKAGQYFNAIELYKKAYTTEKKASEKAALIFKVGECYRVLGDAPNAQVWYEKANKAQYTDPITYYYIGEALKEQGKYAEAIAAYNKYKEKNPGDSRADASLSSCQMAQTWKDATSRYTVDPEVLLNSPQYDMSASFSVKKNDEVVFSSSRTASTGTETDGIAGESFLDLFASSRDKLGKWSEPVKLPPTVNTPAHEGSATFNAKRTVMYFTRCQHEKKKAFGCEIWMTKKVGSNYSEAEMLVLHPPVNEKDSVQAKLGHPMPERLHRGIAKAQVVGDGKVGDQRGFLVDRHQAPFPRARRIGDSAVAALDPDMAGIGFQHTGQDLDEGGFPGPVRAHQRHDLTPSDLQRGVLQGLDRAKALGDSRGVKNWLGGIRHGGLSVKGRRPPEMPRRP